MHGTVFQAEGTAYVRIPRAGKKPGPVEDLRVGGVVGAGREG